MHAYRTPHARPLHAYTPHAPCLHSARPHSARLPHTRPLHASCPPLHFSRPMLALLTPHTAIPVAALDVATLDVFTEEPVTPHLGEGLAIEIAEDVLGALL
ncbi:hypothetical protein RIF29_14235 [Crotalaria pallida]|uniref:Uncharacterized protein n=1 Tax=Crotalaria pallida TaxID=3830 RepID=A0AAN9IBF0_CROPI